MASGTKSTGIGIALGVALGAAFGVAAGHMAIWLAIGVAIGMALSTTFSRNDKACPECAAIHRLHKSGLYRQLEPQAGRTKE